MQNNASPLLPLYPAILIGAGARVVVGRWRFVCARLVVGNG